MRSTSLPAHTAYRLLPASVFIISKRTPRSLTCTLLSLSSPVPRIPLHPPQGILASPQYSSTASCCYHFLLLFFCHLSACSDIHSLPRFPVTLFSPPLCCFFVFFYQFLSSSILKSNVKTTRNNPQWMRITVPTKGWQRWKKFVSTGQESYQTNVVE